MVFRPCFLALALLAAAPAHATKLDLTLPALLTAGTAGAAPGTPALLTLSLDTAADDTLTITGPADQASLGWSGATPVTVPAYVPDGSAAPGRVTYRADPTTGRYALAVTYRYFRRSPNAWQTALLFTLAGSSATPLFGAAGSVDPGFFAGFSGTGSITGDSSGLSAAVPASFVQTSTQLDFAVGAPEPPAAALLAVGVLAVLVCARAPFRRRPGMATTRGSPRG